MFYTTVRGVAMAVRILREEGKRGADGAPLYCTHPECILAWNTSVLQALEAGNMLRFFTWLRIKEEDGDFGARCCVREQRIPLSGDEVMLT